MPSRRDMLATIGAAGAATLAGCTGSPMPSYPGQDAPDTTWWPQPRFDHLGSCYNPRAVGPRSGVTERWSIDISGPSARPIVAGGMAYLPTATALRAVDVKTGAEQWRENGGSEPMWPRRVLWHDGTVFVTQTDDPALIALDATTGERQWTFTPNDRGIRALLLDRRGDTLFTGDGYGTIYALDIEAQTVRWKRRLYGPISWFAQSIPELLVATEAGEVYALSADDGRGYWRGSVPGHITALATGNGQDAFVSTFGGPTAELVARKTGGERWRRGVWSADSFVVTNQTLFAAGRRLTALDLRSGGARRWTGGKTTQCGPGASGSTLYAASENRVTAYDIRGGVGVEGLRFGAKRWSHDVVGRPEQGIAVADGAVFVLTEGADSDTSKAYALEEA